MSDLESALEGHVETSSYRLEVYGDRSHILERADFLASPENIGELVSNWLADVWAPKGVPWEGATLYQATDTIQAPEPLPLPLARARVDCAFIRLEEPLAELLDALTHPFPGWEFSEPREAIRFLQAFETEWAAHRAEVRAEQVAAKVRL